MSELSVTFLIGSFCFAASAVFEIRLRDNLTVPTAAAIAPAVALAGVALSERWDTRFVLAVPLMMSVVTLLLARRPAAEVVGTALLFSSTTGIVLLSSPQPGPTSVPGARVLFVTLLAGSCYLVGDFVRQTVLTPRATVFGLQTMLLLLQVVVLCASGLTVLVVDQLGWGAFIAMVAVLGLTRHEFEAFGKSRTAFEQTMRALEELGARDSGRRGVRTRHQQ